MVGDIRIEAPDDAENFSLSSVALPPGGPPSVEIPAFVTGPALGVTVGLLGVQLTPDPEESGDYEIEIRMIGGNRETLFVSVGDDDDDSDSDE